MAKKKTKSSEDKKKGRPSLKTPETVELILKKVSEGLPLVHAFNLAGIGESTGYEWIEKDPIFRRQIASSKSEAVQKLMRMVVTDKGGAWKLLKNVDPENFKETQHVDHSSTDGTMSPKFSDEQLKKAAQAFIKSSKEA